MPKNLKLVPSIILFVFVFLIIEGVANNSNDPFDTTPTSIKCTSTQDCPDIILASEPKVTYSFCIDGYCHKLIRS
jgi:hypothetical protein